MLTAKTTDEDIVHGLALGADDYVAKPFSVAQLVLRVQAVLRRVARRRRAAAHDRGSTATSRSTRATSSGRRGARDARASRAARSRCCSTSPSTGRAPCRATSCSTQGVGLRPHRRDRDAHRRHPRREAAPQDRAPMPKQPRHLVTVRGGGYRLDDGALRWRAACTSA